MVGAGPVFSVELGVFSKRASSLGRELQERGKSASDIRARPFERPVSLYAKRRIGAFFFE